MNKLYNSVSIRIVLSLILFIIILAIGLLTADSNFNSITGKGGKISIVALEEKSQGVYSIKLMGKKRDINMKALQKRLNDIENTVKTFLPYPL